MKGNAWCWLIALAAFAASYFIFGFYYEEYEALFDGMLSGSFSPGFHFNNWYYMGHIGLGHLYALLYRAGLHIEWVSLLQYGYLWLATGLIMYLLKYCLSSRLHPVILTIVYVAIFLLLLLCNILPLQYTRVSCMVCGSSLLGLSLLFGSLQDIKDRPLLFVALLAFFLIGTLTRLEAGMGTTALLFFFALVVQRKLWFPVLLFIVPTIICLSILGWIMVDSKNSVDFYKQIEPDVEFQLMVRGNIEPPVLKDGKDSLRFEAAMSMLWCDPAIVSNRYLRSLIGNKNVAIINRAQWLRTLDVLKEIVPKHWPLLCLNILMVLALMLRWREKHTLSWLLYNVVFWLLIFAQTYFVKIEDRAYLPFLCIYTLGNVLLWAQQGRWELGPWRLVSIIAIGLTIVAQMPLIVQEVSLAKTERHVYQQNMQTLKKQTGGQILLLNSQSYRSFMLNYRPLQPFDASAFYRVYLNDVQVTSLIHPYKEFLDSECHCDVSDFSNLFRYLQQQDKRTYMLTTPMRADLITRYLHTFHSLDISLKEVDGAKLLRVYDHEFNGKIQLVLFELQRIK